MGLERGCKTESLSHSESIPDMWFVEYLTPHDAYHHGVKELLHASRTHFQSMTIADTGAYGRALFLDGKIQTAEGDEAFYHEPLVHGPCVWHGSPESVLILGGADGGAAREALQWGSVKSVVVVDIDGEVVNACRKYLPQISRGAFESPRCELIVGDALDYIGKTTKKFDVIICDLTDPMESSPSLSLFTREFFSKLRRTLSDRGAVSIQAGPASLVESGTLFPRICSTLRSVFQSVHPYQVFVPTYGSPLGMVIGATSQDELPSVETVDEIFAEKLEGSLHVLDGRSFHGLFALPRCTSIAIEAEKAIFTEENTANAFGKGSLLP